MRRVVAVVAVVMGIDACHESSCEPGFCKPDCTEFPEAEAGTCPIDDCVEAGSEESGIACCLERYGYGLDEDNTARLMETCVGDACNQELYVSDATALCIAQVYGLGSGLGSCSTGFVTVEAEGTTYNWWVENVHSYVCAGRPESGEESGDLIILDALDGTLLSSGQYTND